MPKKKKTAVRSEEIEPARAPRELPERGRGPAGRLLVHGITGARRRLGARDAELLAERPHRPRARPARPRRLGQAARRLLARRLRQRRCATCCCALGHDRATVVGHSLGGGIAMQFAYQFPERSERLVLVSSGGLGREVQPAAARGDAAGLRARAAAAHAPRVLGAGAAVGAARSAAPRPAGRARPRRGRARLRSRSPTPRRAPAFLHTLRAVDRPRRPAGQRRPTASTSPSDLPDADRLGRARPDHPGRHRASHTRMPGSRLEIFEGAGHFPHLDEPVRFARTLADFIAPPSRPTWTPTR